MLPAVQENSVSADDAAALRAKIYQLESTLSTMAGDKKGLEQLLESLNTELAQVNEEAAMVRQKLASMNATEAHLHQLLRESQVWKHVFYIYVQYCVLASSCLFNSLKHALSFLCVHQT